MFFVSCVSLAFVSIAALWSPAGKEPTSCLLMMFILFLLLSLWYHWSGVVLDCIVPDLCRLSYFHPD